MAGGVFHNIGQLVVAAIVVETYSVTGYLPVLLVAGLITGFLIGTVANGNDTTAVKHRSTLKSIWNRRGDRRNDCIYKRRTCNTGRRQGGR